MDNAVVIIHVGELRTSDVGIDLNTDTGTRKCCGILVILGIKGIITVRDFMLENA